MKRTSFPSYLFILSLLLLLVSCNDPCRKTDCENGTCVDGTCECFGEWQGAACDDGSCIGIECNNGGECLSGVCDCAVPYYGTNCDSLIDNQFTGTYEVSGGCATSPYILTLSLRENRPGELWVHNLEENGISLMAVVTSERRVEILTQTLNDVAYFGRIIRVDENTLEMIYSVDYTAECTVTLEKN